MKEEVRRKRKFLRRRKRNGRILGRKRKRKRKNMKISGMMGFINDGEVWIFIFIIMETGRLLLIFLLDSGLNFFELWEVPSCNLAVVFSASHAEVFKNDRIGAADVTSEMVEHVK